MAESNDQKREGRWRLRLFGGVSIGPPGGAIDNFGTVRAAKLLVLLGIARSGRMPREQLAEQLWPDDFYDATRLRLRQELHRLKRALADHPDLLNSSPTEVWIDRTCIETELDVLDACVRGPLECDPDSLFLEPFLPGWDDPWVLAHRNYAESMQRKAAAAWVRRHLDVGDAERAHDTLQRLITAHPLDEELRRLAVEVHAQLGSIASAVAEFQDYRRKLKERLGVDAPDLVSDLATRTPFVPAGAQWAESVPAPTDPIFGREEMIAALLDRLKQPGRPIVSLVGPGGIGKTRLATETGQRLMQAGHRVGFIALADVVDPAMWARDALNQLHIDPPAEADALKFLGFVASSEPTVLILDNFESVLPEAANSLATLVASAPKLRLLVTSVMPTTASGEVVVPVGPLDPQAAGVEFLQSAWRAYRPAVSLSDEEQLALVQIAEQMDGYPLAMRLASARFRLLTPSQLLNQLDAALSRYASQDLPERHRSLDSALHSAYESLADDQRSALIRIAAFPGGMGMELCAIAFAGVPYLDLIEGLLDLALLVLDDHSGFARVRMLSPIRRYLRQRQTESDIRQAEDFAVRVTLEFLQRFDVSPAKPFAFATLDQMESEAENIMFAWRRAVSHDRLSAYSHAGRVVRLESSRGRAPFLLEEMLPLAESWQEESPERRVTLDMSLVHLCLACHREEHALSPLTRARASISESSNPELAAILAASEAMVAFRRDFGNAESLALLALSKCIETDNLYLAARVRRILGLVTNYTKRLPECREYLLLAYQGLEQTGGQTDLVTLTPFLAAILWHLGEREQANVFMQRAKVLLEQTRDPLPWAFYFETQGRLALSSGDPLTAEGHFRESLRIWEAVGSAYQEADQYHSISHALIGQGKFGEARSTVLAAADRWIADDNDGGLCCTLVLLAVLLEQSGQLDRAKQVVAFARDFDHAFGLTLVESELDFREQTLERFGECRHDFPITRQQSRNLFNWIR